MVASVTEITVETSPIPIELISGRTNSEVWNIPEKFDQDHWLGQKFPSVSVAGALNASATSHQIGNSVHAMVIALVTPQLILRPVISVSLHLSVAPSQCRSNAVPGAAVPNT